MGKINCQRSQPVDGDTRVQDMRAHARAHTHLRAHTQKYNTGAVLLIRDNKV